MTSLARRPPFASVPAPSLYLPRPVAPDRAKTASWRGFWSASSSASPLVFPLEPPDGGSTQKSQARMPQPSANWPERSLQSGWKGNVRSAPCGLQRTDDNEWRLTIRADDGSRHCYRLQIDRFALHLDGLQSVRQTSCDRAGWASYASL